MRLTKEVRQKLLEQNEGFKKQTYFEGRNSYEAREYEIKNRELVIRSKGKGAWADSRYDNEWVADDDETHRFLYKYLDELNYNE